MAKNGFCDSVEGKKGNQIIEIGENVLKNLKVRKKLKNFCFIFLNLNKFLNYLKMFKNQEKTSLNF